MRHQPDQTPSPSQSESSGDVAGRETVDSGERHADRPEDVLEAMVGEAGPREIMRNLREANREAVSEAREAVREAARNARAAEREVARSLRETRLSGRHDRTRVVGEPDTRARIQQVALELFTANGYEATSLREIAEALGVTKAALYYHFRTKDDIIDSLVTDRMTKVEELIAWADGQPRSVATRREALRRYADMLHAQGHHGLMRFFERNQSSMTQHKAGVMMRDRMMRLLDVLADPDASLPDQIRCSLAIFALHSALFTIRDPQTTDEQRREAALTVALDLVESRDTPG